MADRAVMQSLLFLLLALINSVKRVFVLQRTHALPTCTCIGLTQQRINLKPSHRAYSRTPLIRPPSESHWCGRIRGMVAREGFVYEQKPLSVTRNVVV